MHKGHAVSDYDVLTSRLAWGHRILGKGAFIPMQEDSWYLERCPALQGAQVSHIFTKWLPDRLLRGNQSISMDGTEFFSLNSACELHFRKDVK